MKIFLYLYLLTFLFSLISCNSEALVFDKDTQDALHQDVSLDIIGDTKTDINTIDTIEQKQEDVTFDEQEKDQTIFDLLEDGTQTEITETKDQKNEDQINEDQINPGLEPLQFRITTLSIDSPQLCMPQLVGARECMPVNDILNSYMVSFFDDKDAPIDITGIFEQFMLDDSEAHSLTIDSATCERDNSGNIIGCYQGTGGPVMQTQALDCFYSKKNNCEEKTAPCFHTNPGDVYLKINALGIELGLKQGTVAGEFKQNYQIIKNGTIKGFLPLAFAKTVQICLPDSMNVPCFTLDYLFSEAPMEKVDGVEGYWMKLSFSANHVPILEDLLPD